MFLIFVLNSTNFEFRTNALFVDVDSCTEYKEFDRLLSFIDGFCVVISSVLSTVYSSLVQTAEWFVAL